MNLNPNEPGYKGFKDYTPRFLKIYNAWVLRFMAPRVWKMGDEPGLDLYRKHMKRRHLDVGPGTGYFIAESSPAKDSELTLVDPNPAGGAAVHSVSKISTAPMASTQKTMCKPSRRASPKRSWSASLNGSRRIRLDGSTIHQTRISSDTSRAIPPW